MFPCVILLILYSFMESLSEKLRVFGPEAPLSAVAGDDLVLPCFIQPNTSAVDMTVEWLKLEEGASLVHLYKDHEDRYEKQAQSYIGRTSLFKDELQKGNTSLKLSSLRVSDEGEYKCLIEHKSWYDDITVNVVVEGQGSHPVITMESYDNSGGINLVCESRGWNPEPDVLWLDRKGDTLPAEETQIHRETGGFSVKRRITVYDYSDSNRFYCRLLQKHHMIEGEVIINSKVFDVWKSNADAWKWNAGILISACLIALGLIVTAVIRYKREMQQGKERQCTEFLKKKKYAVDVTLDPDTAHPYLTLSPDRKQVSEVGGQENLDDTPQRFSQNGYVVGNHGFSSGRFYFEVQVSGKSRWILGIIRENVNRKGQIERSPQKGFWAVRLFNEYSACTDPETPLRLKEKLEKIGVFVDYEEGLVSFYNVKSRYNIYSFTGQKFNEKKLYPLFCPWHNADHKNSTPLIITLIETE